MKKSALFLLAGLAATLSGSTLAAPRAPSGPGGGGPGDAHPHLARLTQLGHHAPASLSLRKHLHESKVVLNGKEMAGHEALAKFDPKEEIDLDDGTKLSVKDLVQHVDESESEAGKQGASLHRLAPRGVFSAGTAGKRAAQRAQHKADLANLRSTFKASGIAATAHAAGPGSLSSESAAPPSAPPCADPGCAPKDAEHTVRWDKNKGDEDIASAYSALVASEKNPDASTATCAVTWDNGITVLKRKFSLLKYSAEATGKKPQKADARAALYVLGQASPVWKKDGKVTGDKLDRTFGTANAKLSYKFIPLVAVEGGVQTASTLGLKPELDATATASEIDCGLGFRPSLASNLNPEVRLVVGLKKLAKLAQGGIKAELALVDLRFPTQMKAQMPLSPPSLQLGFTSEADVAFLRGRVFAWYKIKDVCHWGVCLLSDILHIHTKGEIELWEDADGFPYKNKLIAYNGPVPFVKR
jgi:hypothetical protein